MGMTRVEVRDKGVDRWSRAGDGWLAHPITPVSDGTDGGVTITDLQVKSGIALFGGFTGANTITTPTAAELIAMLPGMNIDDTYVFIIANTAAFAGTVTAGDGDVTVAGIVALTSKTVKAIVHKTSATTVTITCVQ